MEEYELLKFNFEYVKNNRPNAQVVEKIKALQEWICSTRVEDRDQIRLYLSKLTDRLDLIHLNSLLKPRLEFKRPPSPSDDNQPDLKKQRYFARSTQFRTLKQDKEAVVRKQQKEAIATQQKKEPAAKKQQKEPVVLRQQNQAEASKLQEQTQAKGKTKEVTIKSTTTTDKAIADKCTTTHETYPIANKSSVIDAFKATNTAISTTAYKTIMVRGRPVRIAVSPNSTSIRRAMDTNKFTVATDKSTATKSKLLVAIDKPSTDTSEPLVDIDEPSIYTYKPLIDTDIALAATDKPLVDTDKLLIATDKSSIDARKPLVNIDEPSMDTDKPLVATDKPLVATNDALVDADEPLVDTERHLVDTDKYSMYTDKSTTEVVPYILVSDNNTAFETIPHIKEKGPIILRSREKKPKDKTEELKKHKSYFCDKWADKTKAVYMSKLIDTIIMDPEEYIKIMKSRYNKVFVGADSILRCYEDKTITLDEVLREYKENEPVNFMNSGDEEIKLEAKMKQSMLALILFKRVQEETNGPTGMKHVFERLHKSISRSRFINTLSRHCKQVNAFYNALGDMVILAPEILDKLFFLQYPADEVSSFIRKLQESIPREVQEFKCFDLL